jgi:hypothetical protein
MTINPRYFELIQADIDGEIDESGKAELENFLADNEEGRAVYEELETLCHSLDSMPQVDPPQHLRHMLLNQAPVKAAPRPEPGLLQRLFSGPALGYVGVFTAGVALTLALVDSGQISKGAFDDVTGLVGTIAEPEFAVPEHSTISIDESDAQLESSGTSIASETGAVTVKMDGKRRYAVYLNNPRMRSATVDLRFMADNQVIHEAQLSFPEAD